ncbi:CAP domain-containing protein [Deinococcus puniceus]|uniref:CAP domain-containing protein n=1 Tax=Deinococcus puniceus TaxID=1182568 RepID=UPI0009EF4762|nr:CAP domain-containing protein [Deinococcus puniceus]
MLKPLPFGQPRRSPAAPAAFLLLALTLAACGSTPNSGPNPAEAPALADSLKAQASAGSLTVGQTRQLNVTVSGRAPQPGELTWTTGNAAVATVSQTGLVTAKGAGSTSIRTALTANPGAFIEFTLTVTAAGTTPAPAPAPAPGTFAGRVLTLTNAARAQARTCGTTSFPAAAPLTANAQLGQAAQGHAADMAAKNYFSHTSQDGRTMAQRVSATGYAWRSIGENIAAGQTTPEAVVDGWLKSPGHCRNIMSASFTELGVGYAAGGSYSHYWVQDFGRR